jgi:Pathogenicity locus
VNPTKVVRERVKLLTDLPNIGKSLAADLQLLGIHAPAQLAKRDPFAMYEALCEKTGVRQDPCVLDVFISVTRFIDGEPPAAWWTFTELRKKMLRAQGDAPR